MGDRISIQFKNGNDKSVVLFSHWGGMGFYQDALQYADDLKEELKAGAPGNQFSASGPLGRLEPQTVMVDFIRHTTKEMDRVVSDLYLGADPNDGDSSDNGHFIIDLVEDDLTELIRRAALEDQGDPE